MAYNPLQKFRDNIKAIRIALDYRDGVIPQPEDQLVLQAYSGFGGLKAVLFPAGEKQEWINRNASQNDLKLYPSMMELYQLLKDRLEEPEYRSAVQSIRDSILTAYYTPAVVPQILYQVFKEQGVTPQCPYEPSSGAGVFITELIKAFPGTERVTAVEKDVVTGLVLQALSATLPIPVDVQVKGLEETPATENGQHDLIVSNIPFGSYQTFDPAFPDKEINSKIHNYFFAKGLDKLADGGIMAFITTDAFLNNPSNQVAREYLFTHADFISLAIMPDNLMKDSGNTEASSHLLIVQKHNRGTIDPRAQVLIDTVVEKENEFGKYYVNAFVERLGDGIVVADSSKPGKSQYGQAHTTYWQNGKIEDIAGKLKQNITEGFLLNFNREAFQMAQRSLSQEHAPEILQKPQLDYLPMPDSKSVSTSVQLGLFDTAPTDGGNRAMDYIQEHDEGLVQKNSARLIGTIRTKDKPEHESVVLITARHLSQKQYLYKLVANVGGVIVPHTWLNGHLLSQELPQLVPALQAYNHDFYFEGDQSLKENFNFGKNAEQYYRALNAFHQEGSLVTMNGQVGHIHRINENRTQAVFEPMPDQKDARFYERYTLVRDTYLALSEIESLTQVAYPTFRADLNIAYNEFTRQYGELNRPANRRLILADEKEGFKLLSSIEVGYSGEADHVIHWQREQ